MLLVTSIFRSLYFPSDLVNLTVLSLPREENVSGTLLIQQVQAYTDSHRRLYYAKRFVLGAASI